MSALFTSVAEVFRSTSVHLEAVLAASGVCDHSGQWTLETAADAGFVHLLSVLAPNE